MQEHREHRENRDQRESDVIVIGGGIIGLISAYYLAKDGKKVRIIEQDHVGAGASHGNCGLLFFSELPPLCQPGTVFKELGQILQPDSPLYIKFDFNLPKYLWLLRFAAKCNRSHLYQALKAREKLLYLSRSLYRELMFQEQPACDWQRSGILMIYKDQAAMDAYEKANALLKPYGLGAKPISKSGLLKMEPSLHPDVCGAWHHEHDSHVRPEKLLTALMQLLIRKGVEIEEHCILKGFDAAKGKIRGIVTSKGNYSSRHYVLAAGAWIPGLSRQLGVHIPILPAKGYSITTRRPDFCPRIPCYFHDTRVVATPWPDGLRLGGTLEFSGFNTRIDAGRIASLKKAGEQYLRPSPQPSVLEEWAGLRPMTYDDLPVIGRAPGHADLIIAGGHGMMGMTMATGTGRIVADLAGGRDTGIDIKPFSPTRF